METKIFGKKQTPEAVKLSKGGESVAFPTETVYGFGALATNERTVKGVYVTKGRPNDNPLTVAASDEEMMENYINEVPERAKKLIRHFWPGSLIIILFVKEGTLPSAVIGGLPTAALRCPDDELTHDLISELGKPTVSPSANISTEPSPTATSRVYHSLKRKIIGIIDNGPAETGSELTIVDLSVETPAVFRPGEIIPGEISKVPGEEVSVNKGTTQTKGVLKVPGMKYHHYTPGAPVFITNKEEDFSRIKWNKETGVVASDRVLDKINSSNKYSLGTTTDRATRSLFGTLRYFDGENNIRRIYVQDFSHGTINPVYVNRLDKAAAGHHFH